MLYPNGLIMGKAKHSMDRTNTNRVDRIAYTKHYYIGSERVSAKTGTINDMGMFPADLLDNVGMMPNLNVAEVRGASTATVDEAEDAIKTIYVEFFKFEIPEFDSVLEDYKISYNTHDFNKLNSYWLHPDHLGSSSYVTNEAGVATQHMEYLPFGETLVDEHTSHYSQTKKSTSFNSPFKYNGKEFDEETGNYYYGARYYDPKWSIFISVDPLAEKYPDWSSYAYAYNNPVRFIDPTGMENEDIIKISLYGGIEITKAEGDDVVQLVDKQNNNKVVDSYVYGKNGSFMRDTKIEKNFYEADGKGFKVHFNNFCKAEKFYKFAAKSNVEYGILNFSFSDCREPKTTVMTTCGTGTLASNHYMESMLDDPNCTLLFDSHSHPSEYNDHRLPYPSGFNSDLSIGPLDGDREHYLHLEEKYKGRIPQYFEVYTPSMPNVSVRYNGRKAIRKINQ